MKSIRRILFPTDFSPTAQNAFRHCLMLAEAYGASVQLLHVAYPEYDVMDMPIVSAQATKQKTDAATALLQSFTDQALLQMDMRNSLETVPVITSEVEIGTPVDTAIRVAEREKVDLIVMGTRGEHDILDKTFGSVASGVIRRAECPVWVVPEETPLKKVKKVVYASNLEEDDPQRIVDLTELLAPFEAQFHCVHVNKDGSLEDGLDFADLGNYFRLRNPKLHISFHSLSGDSVANSIEQFAENSGADLLVMYAPHYNWLERLFHTSQTRKIALDAAVPLLVLKD